jgi:uncharacterized membrane protein YvbJ
MTWDKIKNLIGTLDTSVLPFIAMVIIVISLIVSLPYFLGQALDEQTKEINRFEKNIYNNETQDRTENVKLFNFTLNNVTGQGKINEGKIDSLLNYFNLTK